MIGEAAPWTRFDPWFLAVVPAVWALFALRLVRGRAALPAASLELVSGLPTTLRARVAVLPTVLSALALTAFGVALCRPVSRDVLPLREEGVDIALVLDMS